MRCYLTVAAVHCYQRLAGYPVESDGPWFDRAERELFELCGRAKLAKDADPPHAQEWRVRATLRGQRVRLELHVAEQYRPEGPLPQLIYVRTK